ncbi:transposable element Tc1 transposase [Trichonephila clavipes]|nr:transposable element Tc1 transposase [Trichonephila clavipes]
MVWAGIMLNSRTLFHIFERGDIASQQYCREIILDHVHIFRRAVGTDFLFMDDNAQPHRSVEVSNTLQNENILLMQWRIFSHLNPIENAWNALGRHFAQRTIPPRAVQELKPTLREE